MTNHCLPFFFLAALSACVMDGSGTAPDSIEVGGEPADGDSLPEGAISYFKQLACPKGWEPFEDAHGRSLVPAAEGFPRGTTIGEPLDSAEERSHDHAVSIDIEVPEISYAGAPGGGNGGVGQSGTVTFATTAASAPDGVPYVQMLVCKKAAAPVKASAPLPSKMLLFFDADACPDGWKPAKTTPGRLLVGLPQYAPADRPYGGEPFSSAEPRAHTHSVAATLSTTSHGIGLLANGAASGYAKNGEYMIAGDAAAAVMDMPVLALLQCEKE